MMSNSSSPECDDLYLTSKRTANDDSRQLTVIKDHGAVVGLEVDATVEVLWSGLAGLSLRTKQCMMT